MQCIAVDWSGAAKPRKKIWLAQAADGVIDRLENCPSRESAVASLESERKRTQELVVGLDFAFSLPDWFLTRHKCSRPEDLWRLAAKKSEAWVKSPPFYGQGSWRKSAFASVSEFRETELRLGGAKPSSVFKVVGAQQVGKSSLTGMPKLLRLREVGFAIWPFDEVRLPLVVEIYPRLFYGNLVKSSCTARCRWLDEKAVEFTHLKDRDQAVDSDDAFDAAVSAWCMSRQVKSFLNLSEVGAPYSREGKIWQPGGAA